MDTTFVTIGNFYVVVSNDNILSSATVHIGIYFDRAPEGNGDVAILSNPLVVILLVILGVAIVGIVLLVAFIIFRRKRIQYAPIGDDVPRA